MPIGRYIPCTYTPLDRARPLERIDNKYHEKESMQDKEEESQEGAFLTRTTEW